MPTKKPNLADAIVSKIFRDPTTIFGLEEFGNINVGDILYITQEDKGKYYLEDALSGKQKLVYDEKKDLGKPEEIIRQLWLHKLMVHYKYPKKRMVTEKSISFGREVHTKAADIVISKTDGITPYIVIEVKRPSEKKGIDQLKSYLSSEGAEIGVLTDGKEKLVLYRPYPKEYQDSLRDIPLADQTIDDLFAVKRTWNELNPKFDFYQIIKSVEELALRQFGGDAFEEIFKLVYAKLYDEKMAVERRQDQEVFFRKYRDEGKTYRVINDELFREAIEEWPDTFEATDRIKLPPQRLNLAVPLLENIRLLETGQGELEIIDAAFEHLITEVAKGKKGQYFTPRHVIKMCVKMLNPKESEYIVDPACGSGGFLLHSMYHVWESLPTEPAKKKYAGKYVYGLDYDDNMRRISQALMLIGGDGRHHIFKRDSLDARDWTSSDSDEARVALRPLLRRLEHAPDNEENQKTFRFLNFDILMTNPPFAGENPEAALLRQYELAKKDGKLKNNVERHILFIERSLDMVKPGGRLAIVLPQGVFNNTNMEYIREWLFDKARILAVVGLHGNTFKPHTGTKTSVLFLQKWGGEAGQPLKDYPIFMAVSKRGGKDTSGDYLYKKDANGNYVFDHRARKVLDHDLEEIAEEFMRFHDKEKIAY